MMDGVVAIIRDADRVLLIRRGESVPFPGYWGLASGKREPGETLERTLVREVREELGLDVRPGRPGWESLGADGLHRLYWWTAEVVGGVLQPNPREVSEARWVTAEEFEGLSPVLEGDRRFFRQVLPTLEPGTAAATPGSSAPTAKED